MWFAPLVVSLFALPFASPSDVRLPPTITVGPGKGNYYRPADSFTLKCTANGVPEVTYEWKMNGVDLNLNRHNVIRGSDGTITISEAGALDAGFYQCIAKNQYGTALSNTSWMQLGVLDSKGSPQVAPKVVNEGDSFCVEAIASKSVPKAKNDWQMATNQVDQSPSAITLSRRIQLAENGDLCFAYAKQEDDLGGKIYKLNEFNERLDRTIGGSYTRVTVNRVADGPKQFSPVLSFSSPNQTIAVEGQNVTLSCFFSGNPEPTPLWNGPKNARSHRYVMTNENTRLTLRNVQPSDEGDYTCTADNGIGKAQHVMQIRVEAVPTFLSTNDQPHDTNVTEGASITFRCHTYAKPEATVVWLRNGEPLDLNQLPRRYRISSDKKSLTIENLCRDCTDRQEFGHTDLTIIQCNASNTHGYAFGAGYINVLLKTSLEFFGEREISVDKYEEKEFTWECKATSDPSTPPVVTWFKETNEDVQKVYDEPPALLLTNGTLTIHVVPNKTTHGWEKYHGRYRCDAETRYSTDSVNVTLRIVNYVPPEPVFELPWWVFLIIVLVLLLLLFICICCICLRRNKGDTYNVDATERKHGHDPEKEQFNDGFEDYRRPEGQHRKGSRGSFSSVGKLHSDDEASLMEFGDDPGKFTEDGSFVGAYSSNTADRYRGRME